MPSRISRVLACVAGVLALVWLGVSEGPRWYDHLFGATEEARSVGLTTLPADAAHLPVILGVPRGDPAGIVIFVSGDGGWAGIDAGVTAALVKAGYVAAGFDSVLYFDRRRTPERLAHDAGRLIAALRQRFGALPVTLAGYSFGADVVPFIYTGLPAWGRSAIRQVVLLSPSHTADFWLGTGLLVTWTGLAEAPTLPAVRAMNGVRLLCLFGKEARKASLCPDLAGIRGAEALELPGAHHFDNDYPALGRRIAALIDAPPGPSAPGASPELVAASGRPASGL